jgi:hypothetical protein
MPFPPTFTDVWDITQPPDTQLANLLGQDIRNLKLDVMQRMSLLSGTFANRPTPEVVNATWGGAGYGLLYFSTDTGKIYQWNGAAWTDVTSNFIPAGVNNVLNTQQILAITAANPLFTYTLPGGTLSTQSQGLRISFNIKFNNNGGGSFPGGTLTIRGFSMTSATIVANPANLLTAKVELLYFNNTSFTTICWHTTSGVNTLQNGSLGQTGGAPLDFTAPATIAFNFGAILGADTYSPLSWKVELIH